ncbi:MAG: hypothetical protein ABI587_03325 [Gemmatimonadales bacterium]
MSVGTAIPVEKDQAGSPTRTLEGTLRIVLTASQLVLLALVIREFELESRGLYHTLLFAGAGFVLQALLPIRLRMACFAAVSVAAIFLLFSMAGLWVIAIGLLFLGLGLLPVSASLRLALSLGLVLALGLAREGVLPVGMPGYIWPVVGGMFMFRVVLFLYSVKHEGPPRDIWATLGYLFMIPNAAFPFFPIVDYKTFIRQHYDAPESALYARGISWMTRGVIHLLLYRVIYHYVVVDPADIRGLGDVVQYCLQTYLLYLRVSGQFHLVVGLLHLFGFRLPETHHLYYLSSSFTELWRRINIYWKDFMMKVVYHPTFFAVRRIGNGRAILLSTAVVMLLTWALHGWQKYWIVGGNPFTASDSLFWSVLGVLVVLSAAGDLARARKRVAVNKGYDFRRAVGTVTVYLTMSILFTLWTSESPGSFFSILRMGANVDRRGILLLSGVVGLLLAVGGWNWGATDLRELKLRPLSLSMTLRHSALHASVLGGLVLLAQPPVKDALGSTTAGVIAHVSSSRLNQRDENLLTRGYYESLSSPNRLAGQLWEVRQSQPADWISLEQTTGWAFRNDFLVTELAPSQTIRFKQQDFSINSHGMHDKEYPLAKPPGTYRIAILGASPVMAPGVPDGTDFTALLERRLDSLAIPLGRHVEVLNFGVAGYSALQQAVQLEQKAILFQPDLVLLTSLPPDLAGLGLHFQYLLRRGISFPDPALRQAIQRAGLDSSSKSDAILRGVAALQDSLLGSSITRADSTTKDHGARAALVIIRLPEYAPSKERRMATVAGELGWPILDLSQPYGGQPEGEFRIADYDRHWNQRGNALMARALEAQLRAFADRLGLPPLWDTTAVHQPLRSGALP